MGRKKNPPITLEQDAMLNPDLTNTQNLMATIQRDLNGERDLLNQLLGQAQIAGAFEQFSRTVRISKLAYVKENKLYRETKGMKTRTGSECLEGTWEEFCNLLGMSVDKADMDIANLRAFGEEALESMSRMGIGYRELRQYRKLPEDQQLELIEVAKEGDKAALIDLAEELIAKHIKEKEALNNELKNTKTDLDISRQTVAEKKELVSKLITEKESLDLKLRQRVAREKPDEESDRLIQEIDSFVSIVTNVELANIENGFNSLLENSERTGKQHAHYMIGALNTIEAKLKHLRGNFNLPEYQPYDPKPDWIKEAEGENKAPIQ